MSRTAKMHAKKPKRKECPNSFKVLLALRQDIERLYLGGAFGIALIVLV